ncbi:ROK family protein [Candidatus Nomurabacteria bacterium]|nr:ROK family protein [Candidatus Nomurabacteria bacterium]
MIIAVDTGGTKTLIATFLQDGSIKDHTKFPTPQNFSEYTSLTVDTIKSLSGSEQVDAIVVAIPGIIRDGIAINCPNLSWENVPVRDALSSHFPEVPIYIENDANLGGMGEARMLDDIPKCSLYVTISTGIGTGIIEHGKIDESMSGSEAGHMLLEYKDLVQPWEEFASGGAIYRAYKKMGSEITDESTWREIADRIAHGFYALIPVIQPDVVIIGGSMGTHFPKYKHFLIDDLKSKMPYYLSMPLFATAKHPEEAVINGCYYYAIDHLSD